MLDLIKATACSPEDKTKLEGILSKYTPHVEGLQKIPIDDRTPEESAKLKKYQTAIKKAQAKLGHSKSEIEAAGGAEAATPKEELAGGSQLEKRDAPQRRIKVSIEGFKPQVIVVNAEDDKGNPRSTEDMHEEADKLYRARAGTTVGVKTGGRGHKPAKKILAPRPVFSKEGGGTRGVGSATTSTVQPINTPEHLEKILAKHEVAKKEKDRINSEIDKAKSEGKSRVIRIGGSPASGHKLIVIGSDGSLHEGRGPKGMSVKAAKEHALETVRGNIAADVEDAAAPSEEEEQKAATEAAQERTGAELEHPHFLTPTEYRQARLDRRKSLGAREFHIKEAAKKKLSAIPRTYSENRRKRAVEEIKNEERSRLEGFRGRLHRKVTDADHKKIIEEALADNTPGIPQESLDYHGLERPISSQIKDLKGHLKNLEHKRDHKKTSPGKKTEHIKDIKSVKEEIKDLEEKKSEKREIERIFSILGRKTSHDDPKIAAPMAEKDIQAVREQIEGQKNESARKALTSISKDVQRHYSNVNDPVSQYAEEERGGISKLLEASDKISKLSRPSLLEHLRTKKPKLSEEELKDELTKQKNEIATAAGFGEVESKPTPQKDRKRYWGPTSEKGDVRPLWETPSKPMKYEEGSAPWEKLQATADHQREAPRKTGALDIPDFPELVEGADEAELIERQFGREPEPEGALSAEGRKKRKQALAQKRSEIRKEGFRDPDTGEEREPTDEEVEEQLNMWLTGRGRGYGKTSFEDKNLNNLRKWVRDFRLNISGHRDKLLDKYNFEPGSPHEKLLLHHMKTEEDKVRNRAVKLLKDRSPESFSNLSPIGQENIMSLIHKSVNSKLDLRGIGIMSGLFLAANLFKALNLSEKHKIEKFKNSFGQGTSGVNPASMNSVLHEKDEEDEEEETRKSLNLGFYVGV